MHQPQAFTAADDAFSLPLFRDRSPLSYRLSNAGGLTLTDKVLLAPDASLAKVIEPETPAPFNAMARFFDALYRWENGV